MGMNGEELRTIRKQLGLSLMQFAPQLGIHWNTLARFERGEINISGPVEKLSRLLLELTEKEPGEQAQKSKTVRKRTGVKSSVPTRTRTKKQDRKKTHAST